VARPLNAYVAPNAQLIGEVRLAEDSSVWFGTVIRAVEAQVDLGPAANVQDNCIVEGMPGFPVRIGARTTLGHNARVFGATVAEGSMIAIGATVLAGAEIGSHSIVAANATVPEGMVVPPRTLVIGQGRILREVTEAEIERIESGATSYARLGRQYLTQQS
jgi:carbonic anhydrase/acetyltransferase-like protein (isoleucine patch superfamily)